MATRGEKPNAVSWFLSGGGVAKSSLDSSSVSPVVLALARYLGLALLILVDVFIYVLVVAQFMDLARREAALGFANDATLLRLIPTIGIPAIVAIIGAVTFWLSGRKIYLSVLVAAICTVFVDLVALIASIPVIPIG
jgi:hypothetical protein